ncbi:hypothetical protein GW17_00045308 [Ensete ventricosum]|nr:hypothetical protein GW17_00045308 [Ensete ventricosum]
MGKQPPRAAKAVQAVTLYANDGSPACQQPATRRPSRRLQPRVDGRAGRNRALAIAQAAATCWRPHRSQPRAGGCTSGDGSREGRS